MLFLRQKFLAALLSLVAVFTVWIVPPVSAQLPFILIGGLGDV